MKLQPNISFRQPAAKPAAPPASQSRDAGVVCAVLMPHAPVLVPGVGDSKSDAIANSCRAMRSAAKCLLSQHPESVVLISPHSPRKPHAFGFWADDLLQGSFAQFDAPQAEVSLPLDQPMAQAVAAEMHARHLQTWAIRQTPLDHGALVPLWFLAEAGWAGPTVVLGLNYPGDGELRTLGEAIAAASQALPRRLAVVASGDLSHRLTANAPCGYHPQAHQFDETFVGLVRAGDYRYIEKIAPELRELAAEDAVDSTVIAASAVNWQTRGHQVLNYEGPFGVGYGVAVLFADLSHASEAACAGLKAEPSEGNVLPGVARRAVESALRGSYEPAPAPTDEYLGAARGVFVTIRYSDGKLRGCIGSSEPACPNIVAETWRSARLAALEDHRFPPVTAEELDGLRFEVQVLHSRAKVSTLSELNPQRYGLIISTNDGRGSLLLPGIEEIRTPEQQLSCARKKAGIKPNEPLTMELFQTDHFAEPA
jgi:AmmeMemoRadiSam system protein A